jgi:hypothetical protein
MWPIDNQSLQQHPEEIKTVWAEQRPQILTWILQHDQHRCMAVLVQYSPSQQRQHSARPHDATSSKFLPHSKTRSVFTVPCDLLLDGFCIGLSKQIQQCATEVVCVAVWVAQLVGNSIQEQVPSLNMTRHTCEFHASATVQLMPSVLWDVTQWRWVFGYQHFMTTYQSLFTAQAILGLFDPSWVKAYIYMWDQQVVPKCQ